MYWRHVDADGSHAIGHQYITACRLDRPSAQFEDSATSFCNRNERLRRNRGAVRHSEAHQSLDSSCFPVRHVEDRLVHERDQFAIDGGRQQRDELTSMVVGARQQRIKTTNAVSAICFGVVESEVGFTDYSFNFLSNFLAGEGDADADGYDRHIIWSLVVSNRKRLDFHSDLLGESHRDLGEGSRHDHDKLLATIPADHAIGRLYNRLQRIGDDSQTSVSFLMSVAIIEAFEKVDVDEEHGEVAAFVFQAAQHSSSRRSRARLLLMPVR